jgi:hypothetical protein
LIPYVVIPPVHSVLNIGSPFELSPTEKPSRMRLVRRIAAALAMNVLIGSTALPVLAALWCGSSPSDSCCAKPGEERASALERAPCCKVATAVTVAAREQVTPRVSSGPVVGAAAVLPVLSEPADLVASARPPACMQCPVSPPLGPPLRLRI